MRFLKLFAFSAALVVLSGCTTLQRTDHLYSNEAPSPLSFTYKDGGSSVYYAFNSGDEGWNKILSDPRSIEQDWYGNPYRWWSDIMDIDPLPDFLKLNIPIIIGMGENDQSVPVESARFLDAKFKEAGKNNLTLKVYPEADHRLNGDGVSHWDEFFWELSRLLQQTHNIAVNQNAPKTAQPFLH